MELEKLKEIIADVLNVEVNDITEDTTFVDDLGADSLDIFQIIMGIASVAMIIIASSIVVGLQVIRLPFMGREIDG